MHLRSNRIRGGRPWGGREMYNMEGRGFLETRLWFMALSNGVIKITVNVVFAATCADGQWVVIVILRCRSQRARRSQHTITQRCFSKPDRLLFQSHNIRPFLTSKRPVQTTIPTHVHVYTGSGDGFAVFFGPEKSIKQTL